VWVAGRWDWRGKWVWVAGHWERERAGKRWRDGRWDHKDNKWVFVAGDWVDAAAQPPPVATPPVPPPVVAGPTEAPPPPREEKWTPRAGFVWVAGQWDWKAGKWEWVAGHWERERAGKKWRPMRWEQKDGKWARLDGDWIDANAPDPGPPPGPPGPPQRDHRQWKLERPVVSSYWPTKGKAGSRIVIRGKNFPTSAEVVFGGQAVRGAKVTAEQVVFVVPPGAASGAIDLRVGGRRALPVGQFEVAAAFDPVAEQKRIEEEQRKAAEAAWATRQQQLAKDRAAREAAMKQAMAERAATRERRRAERIAALQAKFKREFLADPETQDELTLHAQRIAELARSRDIAEVSANGKLVVRIDVAQSREEQRHDQRMAALEASFKARGGQP
ncbi:MAG TPA: IPT/TIG domain-containing protein, partial [Kofleriaceae bacterium]|nr:IPT/TIG domain-containing protein [Kofleriaceae bacterium]